MTETSSSALRSLRVAIVGSGPSGFFAADALFQGAAAAGFDVTVDMIDRLPTPFGLVRFGVAPDHPKIKLVTKAYEKTAARPGFRFLGNVEVGKVVSVDELRLHYDAILFTSGAETDRRMGIEGEDLPGSHAATAFVGWYNGHPDYADATFDLSQKAAVIIGQGNVAMDVARILAKTPAELSSTDIAAHALQALSKSNVEDIYVVGRRGAAQAKFTAPELRELGELSDTQAVVQASDLAMSAADELELAHPDEGAHALKNLAVLRELIEHMPAAAHKPRRVHLVFRAGPVRVLGSDRVTGIVLEKTRLEGEAFAQRAVGTGETFTLDCGLVFRSVGYKGKPIVGMPFDDKAGIIPNVGGRVTGEAGLYVAGWIKRGPSGVIGTNKPCAQETVAALFADAPSTTPASIRDPEALPALLRERGCRVVDFAAWQKIDQEEQRRGKADNKTRTKLSTWAELLAAAGV